MMLQCIIDAVYDLIGNIDLINDRQSPIVRLSQSRPYT